MGVEVGEGVVLEVDFLVGVLGGVIIRVVVRVVVGVGVHGVVGVFVLGDFFQGFGGVEEGVVVVGFVGF